MPIPGFRSESDTSDRRTRVKAVGSVPGYGRGVGCIRVRVLAATPNAARGRCRFVLRVTYDAYATHGSLTEANSVQSEERFSVQFPYELGSTLVERP
jgi:hypothetical protein